MTGYFPPNPYKFRQVSLLGRPTCFLCFRPQSHCLCRDIQRFTAHCRLLLLQHPNEWRKYYSTAKLLVQAVENARVLRGVEFEAPQLERALEGQQAYLLYPRPDASDCADVPLHSGSTVVVIDGTWREAAKIIHRNGFLRRLPCLSFKAPPVSQYRIRKQPKAGCLSTLESVGYLLKLNAARSGYEALLPAYESLFEGFNRMVGRQLKYWPSMQAG